MRVSSTVPKAVIGSWAQNQAVNKTLGEWLGPFKHQREEVVPPFKHRPG